MTPWALVATHDRGWWIAISAAIGFLAATSTAVSLLFVPLAVWAWWSNRSAGRRVVVVAFLAGVALQTALVIVATQTEQYHLLLPSVGSWWDVPPLLALRVFALALLGDKAIAAL